MKTSFALIFGAAFLLKLAVVLGQKETKSGGQTFIDLSPDVDVQEQTRDKRMSNAKLMALLERPQSADSNDVPSASSKEGNINIENKVNPKPVPKNAIGRTMDVKSHSPEDVDDCQDDPICLKRLNNKKIEKPQQIEIEEEMKPKVMKPLHINKLSVLEDDKEHVEQEDDDVVVKKMTNAKNLLKNPKRPKSSKDVDQEGISAGQGQTDLNSTETDELTGNEIGSGKSEGKSKRKTTKKRRTRYSRKKNTKKHSRGKHLKEEDLISEMDSSNKTKYGEACKNHDECNKELLMECREDHLILKTLAVFDVTSDIAERDAPQIGRSHISGGTNGLRCGCMNNLAVYRITDKPNHVMCRTAAGFACNEDMDCASGVCKSQVCQLADKKLLFFIGESDAPSPVPQGAETSGDSKSSPSTLPSNLMITSASLTSLLTFILVITL